VEEEFTEAQPEEVIESFLAGTAQRDLNLSEISHIHWGWVERLGWHNKTRLEYLALICSEVGEAINEVRGAEVSDKFGSELADIVLRVADLAFLEGINLQKEVEAKIRKNLAVTERPTNKQL
jgi:NTP pyrophosphatase (non-canonical NTP hydrolase)